MKSYDYDAVEYDGEIYCTECLPPGIDVENEDVHPVFADSEWDSYPVCCSCETRHEYVNLTAAGANNERVENEED